MVYQLSEHTESSLSEGVELLLVCRQTKPHIDSNLNRYLQALGIVHRVLSKQTNKICVLQIASTENMIFFFLFFALMNIYL